MLGRKNVYDSLKVNQIERILVFEPGRAGVLPEFIPARNLLLNGSFSIKPFFMQKALAYRSR